jgi:6-phosphogluconolactonase
MFKKIFDNMDEASRYAAEMFVRYADLYIDKKGVFTVALTGGSSPERMYELLTGPYYKDRVKWDKVQVFHGDERLVPYEHELNNARMADELLLNHVPIPKENIHRMPTDTDPRSSAIAYSETLGEIAGDEGLDMILLGMGKDGHTASLFPGTGVLKEKEFRTGISYNAEQDTQRVTLTAPYINKGKHVMFLVFGPGKSQTVYDVLEGEYQPEKLPAQLIQPEGECIWVMDEHAAALL